MEELLLLGKDEQWDISVVFIKTNGFLRLESAQTSLVSTHESRFRVNKAINNMIEPFKQLNAIDFIVI
jgi:hypothetical protein